METMSTPTISEHMVAPVTQSADWISELRNFLEHGTLPEERSKADKIRREAPYFTLMDGVLYRRSSSQPMLKCLGPEQSQYVLQEIHEGVGGQHLGGQSLALKALRVGYYWPTMKRDASEFTKKCEKCQKNARFHVAPAERMSVVTSALPFDQWGIDLLGPFPTAPGQIKYLIVGIDYFSKWVEAETLSSITSAQCRRFVWRNIFTRFSISKRIITDNGTQFTDGKFKQLLHNFGVIHQCTSVEHPQANGQVEAMNKIIVTGLKKRLEEAKGAWADELGSVLWAYRTTPHSATRETPFRLVYGSVAVIPVEIGEPTLRMISYSEQSNSGLRREELDLVHEVREEAHLREFELKRRISRRYNKEVRPRIFSEGDLVLRRANIGPPQPGQGKLAPNWEGPYKVNENLGKGAYKLSTLEGKEIPRTWNVANLRKFFV